MVEANFQLSVNKKPKQQSQLQRWEVAKHYNVIIINDVRKDISRSGTPDLIAKKGDEIILIEVIDRSKTESAIVDQLERYTQTGKKIIAVLPINAENIEFCGEQNLQVWHVFQANCPVFNHSADSCFNFMPKMSRYDPTTVHSFVVIVC